MLPVEYDFSFSELAVAFLETKDAVYLEMLSNLEAAEHLINHAKHFQYDVPISSRLGLITELLSPQDEKVEKLAEFERNVQYAKNSVAKSDLPRKISSEYLPSKFQYCSKLFFTFGYDLGVVYGNNASVSLAHPSLVAPGLQFCLRMLASGLRLRYNASEIL